MFGKQKEKEQPEQEELQILRRKPNKWLKSSLPIQVEVR